MRYEIESIVLYSDNYLIIKFRSLEPVILNIRKYVAGYIFYFQLKFQDSVTF